MVGAFHAAINDPQIVIGPKYVDKAVDLCVDDDLVCDPDGRSFGIHSRYPEVGMADQGATQVAHKLQASWAADATEADEPATPAPAEQPAPALLSATGAADVSPIHIPGATPGPG